MRDLVAAVVFRSVQLVLFPLAVLGYLIFACKLFLLSVAMGVSGTVLASLYTRWVQHRLGVRPDEPCARLMDVMPNVSRLGLRLVTAPTLVGHRLTGYVPPIYRYPYTGDPLMRHEAAVRTTYFDAALERHLGGISQLVILGAGFDTRAYRLPAGSSVRIFEIDAPRTQAFKRTMLEKAGLDARRITFVPADFLKERWLDKLVQAGFRPDRPSFFLWEGVTPYLDRAAVESTLRDIASSAPGSAVSFDYFTAEMLEGGSLFMRYANATLRIVGEPLRFGIGGAPPLRDRTAEFVAACGLALEEQRTFGRETGQRPAQGGFATAVVMRPAE
jgi:methyltransferase (TIGR00027 family)